MRVKTRRERGDQARRGMYEQGEKECTNLVVGVDAGEGLWMTGSSSVQAVANVAFVAPPPPVSWAII